MLEQFVPGGLHPEEISYSGVVLEELKPMERTHVGMPMKWLMKYLLREGLHTVAEVLAEEKEWSKLKLELNMERDTKNKKKGSYRPLLFNIFINDIEKGIKHMLSKLADNTKLSGEVYASEEWDDIQMGLDKLKKGGV
ncbi:hypothetical protein HGM15179_006518 [Zosterops borbonicus]|uniref:Uncharacterized protein n=1 Tax=Zosterops borbonicus TaxID=364589 RepID=A0A8K1LNX6_9PASS|nr:hypothetical protein HGM15179_006518 [Zosterops borbonicus]